MKCYGWEINNFKLYKLRKSKEEEEKIRKKNNNKMCIYLCSVRQNISKFYDSVVAAAGVSNIFEFENEMRNSLRNFIAMGWKCSMFFFRASFLFNFIISE